MDNGAMELHDSSWTDMTWKPLFLTTQSAREKLSILCLIYGKWAVISFVHFDKICQKPVWKKQAEHLVSYSHERLPYQQVPKLRAQTALVRALQHATISVTMGRASSFPSELPLISFCRGWKMNQPKHLQKLVLRSKNEILHYVSRCSLVCVLP